MRITVLIGAPPARRSCWIPRRNGRPSRGDRADLVGLGVPLDPDEPAAAHPVVPGLRGPAARVVAQVEVGPPLARGSRGWVRARDSLADVLELARVAGTAPGTRQQDHSQASLVADGGRALLTDQQALAESV